MDVAKENKVVLEAAMPMAPIPEVIAEIARGRMVVLVDDEDRENEGDLVIAAQFATPEIINFMITHGRGLVCIAITEARAQELGLGPMVTNNTEAQGTAFTVSVDGSDQLGVTTGISAGDRSKTIEIILGGKQSDLRFPGHMFPLVARPGGSLERPGHTEASVDIARLAGLYPAGVIVEIVGPSGDMLRRDDLVEFASTHGLLISSIELLRAFLNDVENQP